MRKAQKNCMNRAITATVSAICAFGMACTLGACEGQLPQPNTASSTSTKSSKTDDSVNLTEAQEKAIRGKILDALNQANESKSSEGLDQWLSGPMLQIRSSELQIANATGALDAKTTIPSDIVQTVIPTNARWPRSVITITTTTEDQQSQRLLVMRQDSARTNYKLWGLARLFQGAQLPKFPIASIGANLGTEKDTGLIATPLEAVQWYADVLTNGDNSEHASAFAADDFRANLAQLTQTVQEGMERNAGTQQQTFTPVDGQIVVMRSSDGSDLVVAQINSDWVRQAGEGRESLPASDAEKVLFGDAKATSTIKASYVNVIALVIPPADSGKQITAVGAERQVVAVQPQ